MLRLRWILLLLMSGLFVEVLAEEQAQLIPLKQGDGKTGSSTEVSGQLKVFHQSVEVRGVVLNEASKIKSEVYTYLGLDGDQWRFPVQVELYGEYGDVAPPQTIYTELQKIDDLVVLKLNLHLAKGFDREMFRRKLQALLLYEIALRERNVSSLGAEYVLPNWLLFGVSEAIDWNRERADRELYKALFEKNAVYAISDLLGDGFSEELGGILDEVYQVSSGALVMTLASKGSDKNALVYLIQEAVDYQGEQKELISKHFPKVNLSANSLEKWWALRLLNLSRRPGDMLFNIQETEAQLEQALIFSIKDLKGEVYDFAPENFEDLKRVKKLFLLKPIQDVQSELAVLQARAFPTYRPIIGGYAQILSKITQTPKKKKRFFFFTKKEEALPVEQLVARLAEERAILKRVGNRVPDYLNWYEINYSQKKAGQFENYLRVKEALEKTPENDAGPISQYLDFIESLYKK